MDIFRHPDRIRVATYNIHKCRGLDGRVRPARTLEVLREIDADIIALQEVVRIENGRPDLDHARFIADELGMDFRFGENRQCQGGAYGNVLLSRYPLPAARNYDITTSGRESRGCLRADLELPGGAVLHVFNVHLGTAFLERRKQARQLVSREILCHAELQGPRIVMGDFNEWTRGLTTRLLHSNFVNPRLRDHMKRSRTYPGVLPFLHLDHIYYDPEIRLHRLTLHKTRRSLIASDHLPLIADFSVAALAQGRTPREQDYPVGNSADQWSAIAI
ncbi:MAG TPA: endonuclease/exonuclease/phosphatase family protein [Candidatus Dormibacteraeota bacterium]|nr:endonuclease/exonuclease/phosphatase family protein [Candidatus Dormibacteraeota bacterium]